MEDENDLERRLIAKAVTGDRPALHELLVMHSPRLSKCIAPRIPRSLQGVIGVDDIVQQTYTEVFQSIQGFVPEADGSFWAWLRRIADCRAQDTVRALKRAKRGGGLHQMRKPPGVQSSSVGDLIDILSAGSHTPSRSAARHEAVEAIQRAIESLPDDYRQAVQLRLLDGLGLEEAASIMNRSPRAVQGLVDRAKKKMRAALGRLSVYE